MYINKEQYRRIKETLEKNAATLVAVSKIKPAEAIQELYGMGHRDFGENYVQELVDKQARLPPDIRWHFIGHLQSNKVKYIAPFVHLIHGIDSLKLLEEVAKQGLKNGRAIGVLLQVHIADEESKFGFDEADLLSPPFWERAAALKSVEIRGLMGMASFSDDQELVRKEFRGLKDLFDKLKDQVRQDHFNILSMGMSADYKTAVSEGSNMVRIGSILFGQRP